LAGALRRLQGHGVERSGAHDPGLNEALYLSDPDGNGIELYWDRAPELWPRSADGRLTALNDPLDVNALLIELEDKTRELSDLCANRNTR
jgi:catechol 2,3-dioxygenase